MRVQILDTLGLKSHQSVVQIALAAPGLAQGDILEVWGDCPNFERDVRVWCERLRKTVVSITDDGEQRKMFQIQF
jgi:tRNA 2-thiouridine synthesizing protein A